MNTDMRMMARSSRRGGGNRGGGEIHDAASTGDFIRVQNLLASLPLKEQEKLLKSYNSMGRTPLSCASFYGHDQVVEYLMENFPYTYQVLDKDMSYPVHQAYLGGKPRVLEIFLSHHYSNVFKRQRNRFGKTIVDLARMDGRATELGFQA